MRKVLIAAVAALIPASAALADWAGSFAEIDTDGNGRISRKEWDANQSKLKLDPAPTFTAMDVDVNNGVDEEEWAKAEKMAKAFPVSCKASGESWCPKGY
ncbi:MAG: hypothetical protein K2Y42_15170 [Hyphomicrobium sp.]|jgi:hypothetical protein|uniref:hypothetical protein n=1 Tax=Hyphomicrobium sp. TaxID=82 RepID=UPI0025C4C1B5|nr:hypothetical protein [Hyphomicrobium sp.]MBX9864079.1 hypothetical protein [Hyphomicrobium sp.]